MIDVYLNGNRRIRQWHLVLQLLISIQKNCAKFQRNDAVSPLSSVAAVYALACSIWLGFSGSKVWRGSGLPARLAGY